jgi:CRP-like cAMP-binding protein
MGNQKAVPPEVAGGFSARPAFTTLDKVEHIRSVDIFSQASVEELYRLATLAREVGFPTQWVIFQETDLADAFYIVDRGLVECVSKAGEVREVIGPGEVFGLYSALTRESRQARATALENTVVISIAAEDLFSLLSNNMEIVVSMFKYFVKKLGGGARA